MSIFGDNTFKQDIYDWIEIEASAHGAETKEVVSDLLEVIKYLVNNYIGGD